METPDSTDTFRLLFENNPDPMWIYDLETLRFLAVNDAALEQYGYSRGEFLEMDISQIGPPEDRSRLLADLGQDRPNLQHSGVWRHRRRDGQLIDVEITSHTLTYAERSAVLVIVRDVSERLRSDARREALLAEAQAARALLETQARQFDAIFEGIADAVILYGPHGEVLRMNHAAHDVFGGMPSGKPLDVSSLDLMTRFRPRNESGEPLRREDLPMVRVLHGETLNGANAVDILVGPRKGPVHLSLSGAPIRDESGRVVGAVMVARDVSERRHLEEQAQDTLRELNRRMEAFLSIAGHEMRTPMTSIMGNMQLASLWLDELRGTGTSAQRPRLDELGGLLKRMERQGRLLARLVTDLLDTSRIQAGSLALRPERLDLGRLVRELVDEHQPRLGGRPVRVELPRDPLLFVDADPQRIAQVLGNFISNAHKFSPARAPIVIGLMRDGPMVRAWVRDQGPGLLASEHERVWERFYRVDGVDHLAGSSVGLGLGLYLSRTIVEQHGGRTGVESELGSGATFWFSLPLAHP